MHIYYLLFYFIKSKQQWENFYYTLNLLKQHIYKNIYKTKLLDIRSCILHNTFSSPFFWAEVYQEVYA